MTKFDLFDHPNESLLHIIRGNTGIDTCVHIGSDIDIASPESEYVTFVMSSSDQIKNTRELLKHKSKE